MSTPLLEASGISKAFGGVQALRGVDLTLLPGEIHALVGENGAGKSTLIKVLSGSLRPDAGRITVAGHTLRPGDVRAAEAAGIAVIHQESAAFPLLSAQDNVFVGREPRRLGGLLLDRAAMRRQTRELLGQLGVAPGGDVDAGRPVGELPLATRQLVGFARALSQQSRVLVLDEPTASLSAREAGALFAVLRRLQANGAALLYVSHRLDEVFALADRITILRDGQVVDTCPASALDRSELIRKMVGRPVTEIAGSPGDGAKSDNGGDVVLDVQNLSRRGAFADVSFGVRAGEIVGLGGLVGAGRSEVARTVFGMDRPTGGRVRVNGETLPPGSVEAAIARGVALVPEDRQHLGLALPLSLSDNLVLVMLRRLASAAGLVRAPGRERALVTRLLNELGVRGAAGPRVPVAALSGGNQQKIVLGKWLAASPRVLILDEPTRGVDVGAKAEVYRLIRHLAGQGMATLLISSDLPELRALCDRIIVLRAGRVAGELARAEATEEAVLGLAFGPAATNL